MAEPKTTTAGLAEAVERRAEEIKHLMQLGWTAPQAVRRVRESSTLGATSWASVLSACFTPEEIEALREIQ